MAKSVADFSDVKKRYKEAKKILEKIEKNEPLSFKDMKYIYGNKGGARLIQRIENKGVLGIGKGLYSKKLDEVQALWRSCKVDTALKATIEFITNNEDDLERIKPIRDKCGLFVEAFLKKYKRELATTDRKLLESFITYCKTDLRDEESLARAKNLALYAAGTTGTIALGIGAYFAASATSFAVGLGAASACGSAGAALGLGAVCVISGMVAGFCGCAAIVLCGSLIYGLVRYLKWKNYEGLISKCNELLKELSKFDKTMEDYKSLTKYLPDCSEFFTGTAACADEYLNKVGLKKLSVINSRKPGKKDYILYYDHSESDLLNAYKIFFMCLIYRCSAKEKDMEKYDSARLSAEMYIQKYGKQELVEPDGDAENKTKQAR